MSRFPPPAGDKLVQHAFRLSKEDLAVIEEHRKRIANSTKFDVTLADALRSILRWFKEEKAPVTFTEIDGEIAAARRDRKPPLHVGPPPPQRVK